MAGELQRLNCMEVWGGNHAANRGVILPGLDAWVYSQPYEGARGGGGDVYYVSSCATGRITRFLLADVSGHGQDVSEIADALRDLMRRYVNYIDQSELVRQINQRFIEFSHDNRFATVLVATVFSPTNDLTLSNAGHPAPLLYRVKTGTWKLLSHAGDPSGEPNNLPIGIADQTHYDQFGIRLDVGDIVMCHTDAWIEARNRDGTQLDSAGLLEIVRTLNTDEPGALIAALRDIIAGLHPGNLTDDDATILAFRPNRVTAGVPLREKLLMPLRIARALVRSRGPDGKPMAWPEWSVPSIGGAMLGPLNRLWSRRNKKLHGRQKKKQTCT